MSDSPVSVKKEAISNATKDAMRARDRERLATLRLINAELKQVEVDSREALDDDGVVTILTKMLKQRRDSLEQYESAGREDLASQERSEIAVIEEFMPDQASDDEIAGLIDEAIAATGAEGMRDMGKVMGSLTAKLKGRADMGAVSGLGKARLA